MVLNVMCYFFWDTVYFTSGNDSFCFVCNYPGWPPSQRPADPAPTCCILLTYRPYGTNFLTCGSQHFSAR